jgi:predicted glycoside hydrolase/deacetylase ChbG (UPF0249 family)
MKRIVIVNADDFGRTPGINTGIVHAHEHGIVTSASLMVRHAAAAEAAAYAAEHPELSLGLHVDLGEWVQRGEGWDAVYELEATAEEAERQLEEFRRLTGGDPTHLDSHQHVHRDEPARSILAGLAARLGVPLRDFSGDVRYRGDFYGQGRNGSPLPGAIAVDGLIELLRALPEGVTELGCHPGDPDGLQSSYLDERSREVETLCDPRVRAALAGEGIELRSFHTAFDE